MPKHIRGRRWRKRQESEQMPQANNQTALKGVIQQTKKNKPKLFLSDLPLSLLCLAWAFVPREFIVCQPTKGHFALVDSSVELEQSVCDFVRQMAATSLTCPRAQALLQTPLPPFSEIVKRNMEKSPELLIRLAARVSCALSLEFDTTNLGKKITEASEAIVPLLTFTIRHYEAVSESSLEIPVMSSRSHEMLSQALALRVTQPSSYYYSYNKLTFAPQVLSVEHIEWWLRVLPWSALEAEKCHLTSAHLKAILEHAPRLDTLYISGNPAAIDDEVVDALEKWLRGKSCARTLRAGSLQLGLPGLERLMRACAEERGKWTM